jgi:RNA polymerase sigma-70 factor (ECF subfamily)
MIAKETMEASHPVDVTTLLSAWREGDENAGRELMAEVYGQLRRLAGASLRDERNPCTLQPTVLVNELYLTLFSRAPVDCDSRLHFLNLAARQMRRLVIDHARRRKGLKYGGSAPKLTLDEARDHALAVDGALAELDEALGRLEKLDERAGKVIELRFFGGLTEQEAAEVMGVSVATVKRDWEFARSWLLAQLGKP